MNPDQLDTILKRDPIAEFETVFGKVRPCEPDSDVLGLPLLAHAFRVNATKSEALRQVDDTDFSCKLDRYLRIVGEIGFQQVLKIPFTAKAYEGRVDHLFAFWHADGIFLHFDTYGDVVNGGSFHYNWKPNADLDDSSTFGITSSGGWRYVSKKVERECEATKPAYCRFDASEEEQQTNSELRRIWHRDVFRPNALYVGYHDCREAIRHNITKLRTHGSFCKPWVKPDGHRMGFYLVHYGDKDEIDMKDHRAWGVMADQKNKERVAMLPASVRKDMGFTKEMT